MKDHKYPKCALAEKMSVKQLYEIGLICIWHHTDETIGMVNRCYHSRAREDFCPMAGVNVVKGKSMKTKPEKLLQAERRTDERSDKQTGVM